MKKLLLFSTSILFASCLIGQSVGIGTATPNASSKLDIYSSDRGILIPRIILSDVNIALPVASPATGLLVFNTNNAIAGGEGQGFYYWTGTKWSGLSKNYAWLLSGSNRDAGKLGDQDSMAWRKGHIAIGNVLTKPDQLFFYNANSPASNVVDIYEDFNSAAHYQAGAQTALASSMILNVPSGSTQQYSKGIYSGVDIPSGSVAPINYVVGIDGAVFNRGTGSTNALFAVVGASRNIGNATVNNSVGVHGLIDNVSNGLVNTASAISTSFQQTGTGTTTNAYLFNARDGFSLNNGTITNGYGLYLGDIKAQNPWAVYQSDSTDFNFFCGHTAIGNMRNKPQQYIYDNTNGDASIALSVYERFYRPEQYNNGSTALQQVGIASSMLVEVPNGSTHTPTPKA